MLRAQVGLASAVGLAHPPALTWFRAEFTTAALALTMLAMGTSLTFQVPFKTPLIGALYTLPFRCSTNPAMSILPVCPCSRVHELLTPATRLHESADNYELKARASLHRPRAHPSTPPPRPPTLHNYYRPLPPV